MSKRSERPQTRRHVLIFDEDWDWLEANYGPYSENKIGTGAAARQIIHLHVKRLKQVVQDRLDRRPAVAAVAEAEASKGAPL